MCGWNDIVRVILVNPFLDLLNIMDFHLPDEESQIIQITRVSGHFSKHHERAAVNTALQLQPFFNGKAAKPC